MRTPHLLLPSLAILSLSACSASDNRTGGNSIVVDSAGIEIVSNPAPRWTAGNRWVIDSAPFITIGEGADSSQNLTAITGLRRLSNRSLMLVHARTDLRFYDDSGNHMAVVGRKGPGPGEFQTIAGTFSCGGDSLLVVDYARRVSLWTESGKFIREMAQPAISVKGSATIAGATFDCTGLLLRASKEPATTEAVRRVENKLYWRNYRDTVQQEVLSFAGTAFNTVTYKGMTSKQAIVWASQPDLAVGREQIVVGDGASPEFLVYDLNGRLKRIVRWKATPDAVTDADLREYDDERQQYISRNPADDSPAIPPISALKVAGTKPYYTVIRIDDAGNTWICKCIEHIELYKRMRNAPDRGPWTVFDSTGALLGTIDLPDGLQVQHVASTEIGGVWKNSDDVPGVRLYHIRKPK